MKKKKTFNERLLLHIDYVLFEFINYKSVIIVM